VDQGGASQDGVIGVQPGLVQASTYTGATILYAPEKYLL
jgi:hypothetical protein